MENEESVKIKAMEHINSGEDFVLVTGNTSVASISSPDLATTIDSITTLIDELGEVREQFFTQLEDKMADVDAQEEAEAEKRDDALVIALLKITSLRSINPALEDDLKEIGQYVAKGINKDRE